MMQRNNKNEKRKKVFDWLFSSFIDIRLVDGVLMSTLPLS
jgi:hypothetical protein